MLQAWKVENDVKAIEVGSGLSAEEWACLPTAGVTAWSAIREGLGGRLDSSQGEWKGSFKDRRLEGKMVLMQGTGGTSCFAIQACLPLEIAP